MTPKTAALVLSGGGARGAYQVGVLKAYAQSVPPGPSPFGVITGVSVGALNASVLASMADDFQAGIATLETIWRRLHCDHVYRTDSATMLARAAGWLGSSAFGWAGMRPPKSLLDNSPLWDLVAENVDFERLDVLAEGAHLKALAITASSYATGRAVTFFDGTEEIAPWRRARRVGRRVRFGPAHILASAALPLVFPAVEIGGAHFGDGALRENAPLSAAIHLGADSILTIGARDGEPDQHIVGTQTPYPSVGEIAGHLMDIVFNDHADADIERLKRVNETVDRFSEEDRAKSGLRRISLTSIQPSEDIRTIAGRFVGELPRAVKILLRTVGGLKAPYVLPSYIAFEPGYIGALIDLGYRDGLAAFSPQTDHPRG